MHCPYHSDQTISQKFERFGQFCCIVSWRPISNLPFISKIFKKIVASQLTDHVLLNSLCVPFHSAFRLLHSTETAHDKVANDLLLALDFDSSSFLILLDPSLAFSTTVYLFLIRQLCIHGIKLTWLKSNLTNRRQSI